MTKIRSLILPSEAFLFTMDVNALYTNIETAEAIKAVKDIFSRYPDAKRPDKEILLLLDINLTRNDFVLMETFIYRLKEQLWGRNLPPHMQIY